MGIKYFQTYPFAFSGKRRQKDRPRLCRICGKPFRDNGDMYCPSCRAFLAGKKKGKS